MILNEFFTRLNMDSELVLNRFGRNVQLFEKFLRRFPSDPSWDTLQQAIQQQNYSEIATSAHTLKGVCLNFGFDTLASLCEKITTFARQEDYDQICTYISDAKTEYEKIAALIQQL